MSRWRVTFWLDDQKADEFEIGKTVLELKKKRQFARVVKDGISLITSLRAGQTDVLFELFPHLKGQLASKSSTPPDSGELDKKISAAVAVGVQQAIMNAPGLPATALVAAPIKPSSAPIATIKAAQAADASTIADNFLMSFQ